jgi:hypothetical protein
MSAPANTSATSSASRSWVKYALAGAGLAFVAIALIGGYGFHWSWTGFPGNTLWDWLNLLLLPVMLAFLPLVLELPRAVLVRGAGIAALVLVVLIIGGYGLSWSWTGFPGNTLWDWLHLLLLPLTLPLIAHQLSERQKERTAEAEAVRDGPGEHHAELEQRSQAAPSTARAIPLTEAPQPPPRS